MPKVAGEIHELSNLINHGNKIQEIREHAWELTDSVISQPRVRNSRKLKKCKMTELIRFEQILSVLGPWDKQNWWILVQFGM